MTIAKHPHELFDERWSLDEATGCWLWTGAMFEEGYGHFSSRYLGRKWIEGAHRVSWQLHHGEIPDDLFVCHHCDTPRCVNPSHLFLGTSRENTHDAVKKNRMNRAFGEKGNAVKIKADDVTDILWLSSLGVSANEIAKSYAINGQSIRNIIRGITWGHLHAPHRA